MHTKKVKRLIQKKNKTWEDFLEWMEDRTVRVYKDGDTDWPDDDVNCFLTGKEPSFI